LWDELEAKLLLESGEEVGKFGVCGIAWGVSGAKFRSKSYVPSIPVRSTIGRSTGVSNIRARDFIDSFQNLISLLPIIPWKGVPLGAILSQGESYRRGARDGD